MAPVSGAAGAESAPTDRQVWRRARLWPLTAFHALLVSAVPLPASGQMSMVLGSDARGIPALLDHCVFGRAIMPGAGMFELAIAAVNGLRTSPSAACLSRATIMSPLPLHTRVEDISVSVTLEDGRVALTSQGGRTMHMSALCSHVLSALPGRGLQ